jgi:hypothetical protein
MRLRTGGEKKGGRLTAALINAGQGLLIRLSCRVGERSIREPRAAEPPKKVKNRTAARGLHRATHMVHAVRRIGFGT